jgi:hypothetical protein
MALEEPAPAGPPVAPPAVAASPELAPCASASVEPSVSTEDKTIVVSFMSYPFLEGMITGTFIRAFRTNAKSSLSKLDFGRSFLAGQRLELRTKDGDMAFAGHRTDEMKQWTFS